MHSNTKYRFHFIGNSHLDPVWLWDWKEGMSEGLITIRTILELMEEFPRLTYIRGEAAIYEHVEKYDPVSFRKIERLVAEKRWDVVGGNYIQPDTNLTSTEVMARHFTYGQRYFTSRFGRAPKVAWAADSFGHSAGLPTLYRQAGLSYFAFFRPPETLFPLALPAFQWRGPDQSQLLSYRPFAAWYGCERDEVPRRLDTFLNEAAKYPLQNIAVFYGLGNHGGGPTGRHLRDMEKWLATHPEVEGIHSGLHRFFDDLDAEVKRTKIRLPILQGELNFTMRGVYSTGAKFKFPYRRSENQLLRAERTRTAVSAKLAIPFAPLLEPWQKLLFNSFHDVLPATCTERALHEQIAAVDGILHQSEAAEFEALTRLGCHVTCVRRKVPADHPAAVSILAWNSLPHRYRGPLEIEAALDYRPIFKFKDRLDELEVEVRNAAGRVVPFQSIRVEHNFMIRLPWRYRVVLDADLPPLGWSVFTIGWVEKAQRPRLPKSGIRARGTGMISNQRFEIKARIGSSGVQIKRHGLAWLDGKGLGFQSVADAFGPWGDHNEEPEARDLSTVLADWKIRVMQVLDSGPLRSSLWVRLEAGQSQVELTLQLHHDRPVVDVQARVFWNEPRQRLKLVFPGVGSKAEFEVPGGTVRRGAQGEVPGGRWVRTLDAARPFGFASNALYNFDLKAETLRATIVRSSRHCLDIPDTDAVPQFVPVIDRGEYVFRFLMTDDTGSLPRLAQELENQPVTLPIVSKRGGLPGSGSILAIENSNLQLLALKPADDKMGWIVRLQEVTGRATVPRGHFLQKSFHLPSVKAFGIMTYRLTKRRARWEAISVGLDEERR